VKDEIKEHAINIFGFHSDLESETLEHLVPFGIISPEEAYLGAPRRLRKPPHGIIECDNPEHADTALLKNAIFKYLNIQTF
jgi:septin family protein